MVLLERDRELSSISELIADAETADGRAMLLRGPPGVGKTALLEEAARRAGPMRVLRAAGGVVERDLAFGVVRQLLAHQLRDASPRLRRIWLADAAGGAEELLLGDRSAAEPREEAGIVHALYWLLAAIADDSPVVLIVDDVQWADDASLKWLLFLARRLEGLRVAVLGAMRGLARDGERTALALLASDQAIDLLSVLPLTAVGTRQLMVGKLGSASERFCVAAHASTGGNPFLVTELVRAVEREGIAAEDRAVEAVERLTTGDLGERIMRRMLRLSRAELDLAAAVAVLGTEASLTIAAELADLPAEQAMTSAGELASAAILKDALPLRFIHPLVEYAIYSDLGAARRSVLHRRAARLLDDAGAESGLIATHLLRCEPVRDLWAVAALSRAAGEALASGAPESAARFARRALAESPSAELRSAVLHTLGASLQRLGDKTAGRCLAEAVQFAETLEERVQIGAEAAFALSMAGDVAGASALLGPLIREVGDAHENAALTLSTHALSVALVGGAPADEELRAGLVAMSDRLAGMGLAGRFALSVLAMESAMRGRPSADAVSFGLAAVGDDEAYRASLRGGRPLNHALIALSLADEFELPFARWEVALSATRARGSLFAQVDCLTWRAIADLLVGDLRAARADAEAALDASPSAGLLAHVQHPLAIGVLLAVHRLTGAYDAAERLWNHYGRAGDDLATVSDAFVGCQLAALRLAQNDPEGALEAVSPVGAFLGRGRLEHTRLFPWRLHAGAAQLALGNRAAARELFADQLAAALRFGSRSSIGAAQRAAALAEEGRARIAALKEATATLDRSPAVLERAQALLDLGATLRRAGSRQAARDPLTEALDLAHRHGADALVEVARIELSAAGARPRRLVRTGVDSLTPSELRVAKLAAEGLTNRQIAQALFVTSKTVERHLYSAFRKLDVTAREDLRRALSQTG